MAGSEIWDDMPNLQNSQKWQNMTYFQISDMARKCFRESHICNIGVEESSLALKKVEKTEKTTLSPILLKNNESLITLNEGKSDTTSAALKLIKQKLEAS